MLQAGVKADMNCASRGIGYRQALLYLQSCYEDPSRMSEAALVKPGPCRQRCALAEQQRLSALP